MITVELATFDAGAEADKPSAFCDLVAERVIGAWDTGAQIVLLPEFTWMGLAKFVDPRDELRGVAELFWQILWPALSLRLAREGRMVVLGTVPFTDPDGRIFNRAPIVVGTSTGHQDKLHLTPWESAFAPGETLRIFEFAGLRVAVVICLDIEVPEISVALRRRGVDLILVPSATETILGMERVGRCASARAVELGCHVGVAHLVGCGVAELIDENVGRLAWFSPSQSSFKGVSREELTPVETSGFHQLRALINPQALAGARQNLAETNPSLLTGVNKSIQLL